LITNSAKIKYIFDTIMDKQYVLQHISVEKRSKSKRHIDTELYLLYTAGLFSADR